MIVILRFLGTNCEFDIAHSAQVLGAECAIVWHKETALPQGTNLVIVPGGFSYGDYLRCGGIAKFAPIMKAVREFADNGGFVFGICNGFQILCEAKMLPGALMRNKDIAYKSILGEFEICNNDNALLKSYAMREKIRLPIAHAEGNYYIDSAGFEALRVKNQILLKYTSDINGSVAQIAGICNENKNVFGMMPHPERAVERILGSDDGAKMLKDIFSVNAPNAANLSNESHLDLRESNEIDSHTISSLQGDLLPKQSIVSQDLRESNEANFHNSKHDSHESLKLSANYKFND